MFFHDLFRKLEIWLNFCPKVRRNYAQFQDTVVKSAIFNNNFF